MGILINGGQSAAMQATGNLSAIVRETRARKLDGTCRWTKRFTLQIAITTTIDTYVLSISFIGNDWCFKFNNQKNLLIAKLQNVPNLNLYL